jgi:type II secretory ATPase GspE/PulE/Tfp pilus assembly ATPase PilB-like protein
LHYPGDRDRPFVRGTGCNRCFDTGYQGRIGIYELLQVTRELRDLIGHRASIDQIRDLSQQQGCRLLTENAIALAESGVTSLDEILRVAVFE